MLLSRIIPRHIFRPLFLRRLTILALESSADDTCAAVVTSEGRILSSVVLKQYGDQEQFGGIHPLMAHRCHQKQMPIAVQSALREADIDMGSVDGIAFTRGPGMPGGLSICCAAAKTLGAALSKPIVGVNHMQGHALTVFLTSPENPPQYPFLTLLISGGHTLILLAHSSTNFELLATTSDESIGRTIDKIAKMLKIPWDGIGPGAALERFCAREDDGILPDDFKPFPQRPVPGQLAISFSGYHSHLERYLFHNGGIECLNDANKLAIARAFQTAVFQQLEYKLGLALKYCRRKCISIHHLVVSGGVASNLYLRERLNVLLSQYEEPIQVLFPPPSLCTDNAVMIAWASMSRFLAADYDEYDVMPLTKWPIHKLTSLDSVEVVES